MPNPRLSLRLCLTLDLVLDKELESNTKAFFGLTLDKHSNAVLQPLPQLHCHMINQPFDIYEIFHPLRLELRLELRLLLRLELRLELRLLLRLELRLELRLH